MYKQCVSTWYYTFDLHNLLILLLQRLNNLLLLPIANDIAKTIDIGNILRDFAIKKSRKAFS